MGSQDIKNHTDDDVDSFLEVVERYKEPDSALSRARRRAEEIIKEHETDDESEARKKIGQVSQYSMYGAGYKPTTSTIKSLPNGCYDIHRDSNGIYVVPALKPSGLLLELPQMRSDYVIKLVETFWDSEKDYKEGNEFVCGGAAYKAGIMIYGAAGTGKSCTIKIVANKLIERGGTIFFSSCHPGVVNEFLSDFSRVEPDRKCIVILEDIDSLIESYGESNYLEMLDSAKTIDNVLFIATTNYPEKLDPRIYNRPGRFSHVVKIGLPGPEAREAYLKAILKNHRDVPFIVEKSEGFSIDHLAALVNGVYREKKDLAGELVRLRKLFKVPQSSEKGPLGLAGKAGE